MVRSLILCSVLMISFNQIASAGADHVSLDDLRSRVLDACFSTNVKPVSYFSVMSLRFDSTTQLTLTVYPGSKSEIVSRRILGVDTVGIYNLIADVAKKNPEVSAQEVAARFKTDISRAPVDYKSVLPLLKELETIRISPLLGSRASLDNYSEYEFWYDTGQETVHYSVSSPGHLTA